MRHARVLSAATVLSCAPLSACLVAHSPDADPEPEVAEQSAAVTVAPSTLEAPWSVQLVDGTACTAEALTRHFLLTAAHCLFGKPEFAGGRTVFAVDPTTGNKNMIYDGNATYILDPEYVHESSDRVRSGALAPRRATLTAFHDASERSIDEGIALYFRRRIRTPEKTFWSCKGMAGRSSCGCCFSGASISAHALRNPENSRNARS